ncbi:DUF2732 family protein [Dickeya oryzae]|uniref:DUF2732 family protein n=1 Tax=Dickeya undicola TaxID=1577887 RepID=A0ABX9WZU2_9GAMM|nr:MULTISPECIES: DUF2732 family protein [Dickeya]MBP2844094.1 DUF2732 family protein [Dickeya oryzae]RNM26737.1 DUF2732 family protein [Dickeya undicola]
MLTIGEAYHQRLLEETQQHTLTQAINQARLEAKTHAATLFSSRLDRLAAHAQKEHLSSVEIIELLRQEAERIQNQAGEQIDG